MKNKIILVAITLLLVVGVAYASTHTGDYSLELHDLVSEYLTDRAETQQERDALINEISEEEITKLYHKELRSMFFEQVHRIEQLADEGNYTAMETAITALEVI